jgi:hypothetical protein
MTAGIPDSPLLVLQFEGWAQIRQPTDPDPSDEPRGASGYTFAFGDEPDLDGIVRFQAAAGTVRSHGWPINVAVSRATHVVGTTATDLPALVGATLDLLDSPRLENRNWTLTPAGYEPIVPFHLLIDAPTLPLTIRRDAQFTDEKGAPITEPIWKIPVSVLESQGANGFEFEPATVGEATGIWDSLAVAVERRAALQVDLDAARKTEPTGSPVIAILEGRIAELDLGITNPQDRRVAFRAMIERFGFDITGPATITGDQTGALGGTLDQSSPWGIRFWIGAWDPDVLTAYVSGALIAPYTSS